MDFRPFLELKNAPSGATLRIKAECMSLGRMPDLNEVIAFLEASGIRFGLDKAGLEAALGAKTLETDILVARSKPAVPGKDAVPRMLVSQAAKDGPRISETDKADFRELGGVVEVKAGQALAVLEPAGEGVPGMDVYGKPIPAPRGKDLRMAAGPNTKLSEDGRTLTATSAGCLLRQGGVISVGATFVVEKSVDFATGNVRFSGDVHVKGGVGEGFTVEAGGNLLVEGEVDAATLISRNGSVTVKGGVFGRGKTSIVAKKEVRLSYVQQCTIGCKNLFVEKALQDCDVEAFTLDASAPGCQVFGGKILCYGDVLLSEAGAEGNRTEITILDEQEEEFRRERAKLEAEEAKQLPLMEALDRKLRAQKAILAKSGAAKMPPKVAEEMKATLDAYQAIRRTLTNVQSEKQMLDHEINRPRERVYVLRIGGMLTGSLNLDMFHIRRALTPGDSGKEFLVAADKGLISRDAPRSA